MNNQPLSALQVVGVRYRGSRPAQGDERSIDAFAASDAYQQAQAPFTIGEVAFPAHLREDAAPDNLGLINGAIAEMAAAARRGGSAVLLAGGECTHCTGVLGGLQDAHGPAARIG